MAFCTKCGCQLVENAKFCFECGESVGSSNHKRNHTTEKADFEMGIFVLLDNNNRQEFTENKVYLEHVNKTVSVSVPNNILIGQKIRLRGEGKITQAGKKGDLLLRIDRIEYKKVSHEQTTRKVGYEGVIRKCPGCGEIIDAYETVCKACGLEIRGRQTTSVVHELAKKLEQVDVIKKKDELIRNFYIPNTKEDIYEFFILAISNIKIGGMNTDAWMVKLEQAYQKAELSFGNTEEFERLKSLYQKANFMNAKHKIFGFMKVVARCFRLGYAWALLFVVIGGFMWLISGDSESSISIAGGFCVVAGMWIAMITMINNDGKKKK